MLIQESKAKRNGRQSMPNAFRGAPRQATGMCSAPELYLPHDLEIIVPSQWADLHRRYRPCDSPEGQLMLAVLAQALVDFRQGTTLERRSAKNWFSRRGEGFELTCELLGVDPDSARKAIFSETAAAETAAETTELREGR